MDNRFKNIAIALSGAVQATDLVSAIALTSTADEAALTTTLKSLYTFHVDSIDNVYGDIRHIQYGSKCLLRILQRNYNLRDRENARYLFSLMLLTKQLQNDPEKLKQLRHRLEYAASQAKYFGPIHENVLSNLADTYLRIVSINRFRISIAGKKQHLASSTNMDKIRAILLAGIRSVILWYQVGGSKWQFIFRRRRIENALKDLLLPHRSTEKP